MGLDVPAGTTQTSLAADELNVMRGTAGQASKNLSSAASLANARDQAYEAKKASARQSTISSVATGAGLGMAAASTLPWLAPAAGAGLGAGAGLLAAFL